MKVQHEATLGIAALVAILAFTAGGLWVKSHFEAAAYNRITGANVSTWEAMFVQLRVDGQAVAQPRGDRP